MASLSPTPPSRRGSSSTQSSTSSSRSFTPGGPPSTYTRALVRPMASHRTNVATNPARRPSYGPPARPSFTGEAVSTATFFPHAPAAQEPPDVIPNAIVIKNIPFSLPQEALMALMVDLDLPLPYAFNYHYDQGQFRGLAFANFPAAEDADQAVVALNGFDVSGRKLRAEHKRVLQQGEKERIEKEKAVKRMQSLQRERHRRLQSAISFQDTSVPTTPSSMSVASPGPMTPSNGSGFFPPLPGWERRSGSVSKLACDELNLNDPFALDIYSRVLLFKDDRLRDELAFSKSLTPAERRMVHLVAQRLGLYHYSAGQGEDRCVVVSKVEPLGLGLIRAPMSLTRRSGEDNLARRARQHEMIACGHDPNDVHARLASMRSYSVLNRGNMDHHQHQAHRSMIAPSTLPMGDLPLGTYAQRPAVHAPASLMPFHNPFDVYPDNDSQRFS